MGSERKDLIGSKFCLKVLVFLGCFLGCGVGFAAGGNLLESGKDLLGRLGTSSSGASLERLSETEIGAGLKEALRIGSETVLTQLGQKDGFNDDALIHIPLPEKLEKVRSALAKVGCAGMLDELELRLNRAAENAAPKTRELFSTAIGELTLVDVKAIYQGPDDAATQYFRGKMTPALSATMAPVVEDSLAEVGAIQVYDEVMGQYRSLPFMPDVRQNLNDYVIEKGLDGIFYYLAREEAAIRSDPLKQTTSLLKRLFGQ
ncbi:MAG TPA: DUF4197 domain-containing protein [Proteobacteria bacterium]|nr:DUF4197 domain-containing protein [Pseudomonadota bacterium]